MVYKHYKASALKRATTKPKVLLGLTGSVAAIRASLLVDGFKENGCEVVIAKTHRGEFFRNRGDASRIVVSEFEDCDEWDWSRLGDEVLHIELRRWADAMVIAPLSANTLAKISHGICDNLLTSVVRAWDYNKPLLLAPSMNTMMWEHPFTSQQLEIMKNLGAKIVPPVVKELACKDIGMGAMAKAQDIVQATLQELRIPKA